MIFDNLVGLFSTDMGIDLGTATTLVCVQGQGVVLCEPSVVAVRTGTNRVLMNGGAVGSVAKEMLGKTPGNIKAIRPMKDGVIADFDITEAMLRYFIHKVHKRRYGVKPRVVIAIPSGITAVERRAVINSAERAGARKVYLIEEPKAAALGAGLPFLEPCGQLLVDIGGGTTEVAVLSLGDVVTYETLRVAGDEMDEAIVSYMKREYNLGIGERTSENIKIAIGSVHPLEKELTHHVKGRDLQTGLPRATTVTSEEIREALREPVHAIINAIRVTLERTPPELSADLLDQGVALVGGGSLIRGVDRVIAAETGLSVRVVDDPVTAVARGTGIVLDQLDRLKDVLESGEE